MEEIWDRDEVSEYALAMQCRGSTSRDLRFAMSGTELAEYRQSTSCTSDTWSRQQRLGTSANREAQRLEM
eukprot:1430629-Rhodomonas_salina.4